MIGRVHQAARAIGLGFLVLVGCGADEFRPTPKFEGKTIPDPPRQRDPWTPPETKLPRFLVRATEALCDAGLADPRGCEYREVEIGDAGLVKARGFVLPERPGDAGRFAVGWDGVVYPALAVGAAADLDADMRTLAEAVRKGRESTPGPDRFGHAGGFVAGSRFGLRFFGEGGPEGVESRSPLKVCLLLRLGRADLAESLFAAGTTWTPDRPRPDLTDYHISFVTLANEWSSRMFSRLTSAHVRGDDAAALDGARRLAAFQKAVDAKAEAMGFQLNGANPGGRPIPTSYLHSLGELPLFLADQERRAQEPPRGPIPPRGGDPSSRVAALIRSFDQIHVVQMSVPGSAHPGSGEAVHLLIQEGDAAIGPLLDAYTSDTRLTRSMSEGRGGSVGHIHPVTEAIHSALVQLLKTSRFLADGNEDYSAQATPEGRKKLAGAMRAYWEKNRATPPPERWFRDLGDDKAGPDRWAEAIGGLASNSTIQRTADGMNVLVRRPPGPDGKPAMAGEPYRSRRDPSVSELMARRIAEIARGTPNTSPDIGLGRACSLAESFARWDEAAAMPTIKALMDACREGSLDRRGGGSDQRLGRSIADFTLLRARAGDRAALGEYAAWVKEIDPKSIEHSPMETLTPLWASPDDPSIDAATRSMFTDPKSPWLPLVSREQSQHYFSFQDPIGSPLIVLPWFREAVLATLADKAEVGTALPSEKDSIPFRMDWGMSSSFGGSPVRVVAPEDRPTTERRFRACDWAAWKLSAMEGAPECMPFWPEARRDAAVAAAAEFIRRYGRRFSAEAPPGDRDFPHAQAHLRFPPLGRPASAEDVREARAIFSLEGEGEGEVRVAAAPSGFPLRARWTTLTAFPIDQQVSFVDEKGTHTEMRRDYLRDGWVWQAEEVKKGGRWERFYGFVGHATIARVPAAEIEFPSAPYRPLMLTSGLEAHLAIPDMTRAPIPPGRPIVATLRLRNDKGVDQKVATEFLRQGTDGKPALRRGVSIVLKEIPKRPDNQGFGDPRKGVERPMTRTARFDPGEDSRSLAPAESFDAMQLDLADWFGPLAPGQFTCHLTFAADSGLGEGRTNDLYLTVGDPSP
ncbi:hypothetical protein TA3x_003869 [Tundrisphaera sp. TA3]|uniref:hypothetical protein n=1 Tax=Tundrisphaera sp. TA3 TaxID=3435775 RepID=UPI003EBB7698